MTSPLFTPLALRGVRTRNRVVISPMCQYSAHDGTANDWHFAHLARFAMGGAGIVFVEATAVTPEGRITHGDLGLWSDAQIEPLSRISAFLRAQGAVPAIQLAHAGRKASAQRPWEGDGPLVETSPTFEAPWPVVAPSPLPFAQGWPVPRELSREELGGLKESFRSAARRALAAGFDIVEVHAAHGYLLNEFLSPIANRRHDEYGGDRAGRMRFPLEVVEAVRAVWPADKPLFVRVSAVDGVEGGWTLDDTLALARELVERGVDVLDCSSGGIAQQSGARPIAPSFQVPFAERVRRETRLQTMAVGLIREPQQAESIIADERADLVALGREALVDAQWPLHAERALDPHARHALWPVQAGHWLAMRDKLLAKLASNRK